MRGYLIRMLPLCFRRALLLPVAITLLFAACSTNTHEKNAAGARAAVSLDDTLSLQNACRVISVRLCSLLHTGDTASLALFNHTLDSAAGAIKKNAGDTKKTLDSILSVVYGSWKIRFDPVDTVIETLLPHLVFQNRKSACLGVSLIILMLAEKLHCPVYGVMLPGHFFCRYDDGKRRINIEPNKEGDTHPDDYYRKRYPVGNRPWYDLGNLPAAATIGMLCYNAGALCLKQKQYDAAIACYRESARRIPGFVEAKGNLALTYAKKGNLDTALVLFEELFIAHPDMVNLAANYGAVAMAAKQYRRALEIFRKGLDYFPGDTLLHRRAAKACVRLGLNDSATVFRSFIKAHDLSVPGARTP
jgi:hypothetical protein